MNPIAHLALVKELKRRADTGDPIADDLHARLVRAAPALDRVLRDVRKYFSHFTDHSIDHSARIVRNVECLLRPEQIVRGSGASEAISSIDLFLIVAAAMVHDIGMVVAEEEVQNLVAVGVPTAAYSTDETKNDRCCHGIRRLAIAEGARRSHPNRSMKMLLERRFVPAALYEDAPRLAELIGLVASGHGMDFDEICDPSRFPPRVEVQLGGPLQEECNPRFAAVCLRLGDLLDLGTARVCPLLRGLSEPLGPTNQAHWDQYADIAVAGLKPSSDIVIEGTCPTQDAERLLREWVAWLERETGDAVRLQNTDEVRYRLALGRVRYQVQPKEINGRPAYEFLQFRLNLDEKQVFERLFGKALYGRSELALRELIQNAIDAQRARILHLLTQDTGWPSMDAAEREAMYLRRLENQKGTMQIGVRLWAAQDGGRERWWLSVADSGIGMNRETIANYLLKVGRSRWSEDATTVRMGIGSKSIGTFGIGFISTLMIADRIVVDTKSCLPNEDAIEATIFGWQGFAATAPSHRTEPGTTVALLLSLPELSRPGLLGQLLAQQLPLVDFPIVLDVNGDLVPVSRIDTSATSRQTTVSLDDAGSTLTLRETRKGVPVTAWKPTEAIELPCALCQDGVSVLGVRAPVLKSAAARTLVSAGLLVDLRARRRVPLDLSRNLVEGDLDGFWTKTIPVCWDAILRAGMSDQKARQTMGSLVETLYLESRCQPLFGSALASVVQGVPALAKEGELVCIDNSAQDWSEAAGKAIWFCPPSAHFDAFLLEDRREMELDAETSWREEMDDLQRKADDLRLSEFERAFAREPSVPKEDHLAQRLFESFADQSQRRRMHFTSNVLRAWREILNAFPYIRIGKKGNACLSRAEQDGAVSWKVLLSFPITSSWRSIAVEGGGVVICPADGFSELAIAGRKAGMNYADFLTYLSLNFNAGVATGEPGEVGDRLSAASKLVSERTEISPSGRRPGGNQDGEDEDLRPDEDDENDDWRARTSDLPPQSGFPYFDEDDAQSYRGIAKKAGLDRAVAPEDDWPDAPTIRLTPKAVPRHRVSPKKRS